MDAVLAVLTPELLTLMAWLVGAGLIGAMVIIGIMFLVDVFGWML